MKALLLETERDIDVFHDREDRVASAANNDAKALEAGGYGVGWLRQLLPLAYTSEHKIELKIAKIAYSVSGQVTQDDKPIAKVRVIVAPWPAIYKTGYAAFEQAETDENGSFQKMGLRPGTYRVAAVAPSAGPRLERTEELLSLLDRSKEIELGSSGSSTLNLSQVTY